MKSSINTLSQLQKSLVGQKSVQLTTQGWVVDPRLLVEKQAHGDEYWNRPDQISYIRAIADSFKGGRDVPPLEVEVREGTIYVLDGASRRRGALLAIEEGGQVELVAVTEIKR